MANNNTRDAGASLLAVARAAALEVGDLVREGFGAAGRVSFKRDFHDVVTEYDKRCEEGGILAGDARPTVESAITWYVDPVDGRAFCNGEPMASRAAEADADSVLVTGFPKPRVWAPDGRPDAERFTEMVQRFRSVRRIGSSALTLAFGRGFVLEQSCLFDRIGR